jgi:cytochrome c oxidase subunit IV
MTDVSAETVLGRNDRALYLTVWGLLVLLLLAGLAIFVLPIPRVVGISLIFSVAAVKAFLVLRNYMHLKHEHLLIYGIVLVPALFLLGFALALVPDIVLRHAG